MRKSCTCLSRENSKHLNIIFCSCTRNSSAWIQCTTKNSTLYDDSLHQERQLSERWKLIQHEFRKSCMIWYQLKIMQHQQDVSTIRIRSKHRPWATCTPPKQQTKAKKHVVLLPVPQRKKLFHGSLSTLENRAMKMQAIHKINRIHIIRSLASALQKWYKYLLAKSYRGRMKASDRNCHHSTANKILPLLLQFSKMETWTYLHV
jgi:hypothetical protein